MNTYLIRGFTGPNADFSFTVQADIMPYGDALRDIILAHFDYVCDWVHDLQNNDCDWSYELSLDNERLDLRDADSQRVWVYSSLYCNLDQDIFNSTHRCGEDGDGQGDDSACEYDDYMITVDIEGE